MIGSGIGEFPIGGFSLSDSLSVSDPLPGLLADPSQPREFLLRASNGVDLSSSGYTSKPTDSPYKLFPSAIGRPYNFSVELPTPDLKGGSSLGIGELRINNPDGLRDSDALIDWLGVDADVHIGRRDYSLLSFTRFFRGKSAGVSWDLNSFSILHRDLRFKLQKKLQQNRYMGMQSCLRFDGSGDYVDYGDILDQGGSDSFTVRVMFRSTSVNTYKALVTKLSTAVIQGFAFYWDIGDNLIALIKDGTTQIQAAFVGTEYLDGKLRRFTMVVDRVNQVIKIYVNGDLKATSPSTLSVGSLTNSLPLRVGAFSGGDLVCIGDIDDFQFWSKARTQAEDQSDMHRELTGPETNLEIYSKYNESSGSTASDSSGHSRSGTITGATWVGSLEGDSSIANTPKPVLLGYKRYITPKLVDPQRLVYQWHDGSGQGCDGVQDGGAPYTFSSDVTDIYSVTPSAGTYITSNVNGLFRLGSSPVGVITCTCRGDNSNIGGTGYVYTTSDIHQRLAVKYGGITSSDLNLDTYAVLKAKSPHVVGFYYTDDINVDVAMDDCVKMGANAWWSPDRVAKVSVGRIDDPSTLTPDISITLDNIVDPSEGGTFQNNPIGVRIGRVILGYRRYGTTLNDDQVAGVLSLSVRKDLGEEYRYVTSTDPDRSPDSDTLIVYTEIDDPIVAQAEADRLRDLWKVDRRTLRLSLDQGVLSYFIGTTFEVLLSRYDLTNGNKYVTFGVVEDMGQYGQPDRLEVLLFGGVGEVEEVLP